MRLAAEAERVRQQKAKQDQDDIERERLAEAARQAERVVVLQPSTACTWLQEAPAKGQTFDVVARKPRRCLCRLLDSSPSH